MLGATSTRSAAAALTRMARDPVFETYKLGAQRSALAALESARAREFGERDLNAVSAALIGGPPADLVDAYATLVAELRDLGQEYRHGSETGWRKFWNFSSGRGPLPTQIKSENECRNYLLPDLRSRLQGYSMRPEELTAGDDRIDFVVEWCGQKIPVEAKLDDNPELWTAAQGQLSERYLMDYRSGGFGVYLVFWTDRGRNRAMPRRPDGAPKPATPEALERDLSRLLSEEDRSRVTVVVLDLHAPERAGRADEVPEPPTEADVPEVDN